MWAKPAIHSLGNVRLRGAGKNRIWILSTFCRHGAPNDINSNALKWKCGSREVKSPVCLGGPRAVVAANQDRSSTDTSADATAHVPPVLMLYHCHPGRLRAGVATSNDKKLGKLQNPGLFPLSRLGDTLEVFDFRVSTLRQPDGVINGWITSLTVFFPDGQRLDRKRKGTFGCDSFGGL